MQFCLFFVVVVVVFLSVHVNLSIIQEISFKCGLFELQASFDWCEVCYVWLSAKIKEHRCVAFLKPMQDCLGWQLK